MNLPISSSSTRGLTIQNPSPKPYPSFSHKSTIIFPRFNLKPLFLSPPKPYTQTLSLKCRHSSYDQQQRLTPNDESSSQSGPKVFVGHSIYKGKAALTVEPRPPEFTPLDSGAYKLSREGYVLLQFAPASGARQYDWSRKQVFSLSMTEIGTLLSLGAKDSCEFFHDPNKGRSDEGKVRKLLKVEPLPDGSGHFFNLSVQNRLINVDESIYIPITKAEFAILISAFNFIVPYLLGWHNFANSIKPENSTRTNNVNPRSDYEWNR